MAKDLIAGSHVLPLNVPDKPLAAITKIAPVSLGAWHSTRVHELVLVEGDRFGVSNVIARARSVPKKPEAKPRKSPLQAHPAIA